MEQSQNQFQKPYGQPQGEVVSVKEWIVTILLLCIPVLNIILMFVWAFSNDVKRSKSNYFKAGLIMLAVFLGIWAIFAVTLGTMLSNM
ncbi:MAG: hypothetical protein ACLFQB_11165 [Chitinispirillaceae bacterium]